MILAANFFDSIVNFIQTIASLIGNSIASLVQAFQFLYTAQVTIPAVMALMPVVVGGCCTAVIAIMVVKFLIGR